MNQSMSYLLRIDAWVGAMPSTVTAHAPEILAEPVKESAPCFIISDEHLRNAGEARSGRNRLLISHVGVVSKGTGRKTATGGRTFRAKDLVPVDPALPLLDLTQQLSTASARRLHTGAEERGATLTRDTTHEITTALRRLRPELGEALDRLEALNAGERLVTGDVAERFAEDRDKLGVATRIFGDVISRPWSRPPNDDDPYTMGLASIRDAPLEADAIAYDSGVISGFQHTFENVPGIRQDLKVFHSRDRDRETGEPRVMQTLNVNASGGEAATGGDLLYYHVQSHSCVVVQYKRLERGGGRFRIDKRLPGQIERLTTINDMATAPKYIDDWRLGPDSCYLKLIEPQGLVDPDDSGMIAGRYLPLSYFQTLLNLSGETTSVRTAGLRHLTNSLFIQLVREGWIGTVGVEIPDLMRYCKARAKARKPLLVAVDHSNDDSTRARMARARRRGE